MNFRLFETLQISLTNNINNLGPKIDSWDTPHIIFSLSELKSSKLTNCCLLGLNYVFILYIYIYITA